MAIERNAILIKKLEIHNANALSSPYTIGFPAMTSWLGTMHAIERHLNQNHDYKDIKFKKLAVICHNMTLHTYQKKKGEHLICSKRWPLDQNAEPQAFIPEARCNLKVSLVIEYTGAIDDLVKDDFKKTLHEIINSKIKVVSGEVLPHNKYFLNLYSNVEDIEKLRELTRIMMPAYVILERRDLMKKAMEDGKDALDALLHHTTLIKNKENEEWERASLEDGWIVPIATGFYGLTPPSRINNQRDDKIDHRFAESVLTLGEFKIVNRIQNFDEMMWQLDFDDEKDLYTCKQIKNEDNKK